MDAKFARLLHEVMRTGPATTWRSSARPGRSACSSTRGRSAPPASPTLPSAGGRAGARRAEDGLTASPPAAARRHGRHGRDHRGDREAFGEQVAHIVEGVTKLHQIRQPRGTAGREHPQDGPGHGHRHSRGHRQAGRPPAQHAHPGASAAGKRQRIARETLEVYAPSRTAWAWARCAASWKTWPSATPSPSPTRSSPMKWSRCAARARNFCRHRRDLEASCARQDHRPRRVAHQAPLLHPAEARRQKIPIDQVYDLLAVRVICQRTGLLRSAGPAAQHLAASPRPDQGLHRHAAAQPLPVAAHHAHRGRRPPV